MRYGLEIHQTHNASGQPDPGVFVHDLPERSNTEEALQDVYRFLREIEPTRTDHRGVLSYRDPERGSGTLVVLGLGQHELERLEVRVQIHELERAIGMRDPFLWDARSPGYRRSWRNPWVSTILGALFMLGGFVAVVVSLALNSQPGRDPLATWVGVGMGFAVASLGVFLSMFNARRIQWWTRARAAVKAAGLPMPSDLRPFE